MAYSRQFWSNGLGGGTPLSADRLNHIEEGIEDAGGGGGGGTVVVYAVDAHDPQGDFVCDGIDDQVTILAAINSLPLVGGTRRGTVALSEGTFTTSAPLVWPTTRGVVLAGMGGNSWNSNPVSSIVMLGAVTGPVIDGSANSQTLPFLRDLRISNESSLTGAIILTNRHVTVQNCELGSSQYTGIVKRGIEPHASVTSTTYEIRGCQFYTPDGCIRSVVPYYTTINDCYLYTSRTGTADYCVEIVGDLTPGTWDLWNGTYCTVTNNRSDGNSLGVVRLSGQATQVLVAHNNFAYDDVPAIFVEDSFGVIVANNNITGDDSVGGCIALDGSSHCTVSNNTVFGAGQDGIVLTDSSDNIIADNGIVAAGYSINNTYSGIHLLGNSDGNNVHSNVIRHNVAGAGSNFLKYGIRIEAATCNNNRIINNDSTGAYATAAVSDLGTGTITTLEPVSEVLMIAASDEVTPITVGLATTFRMPYAMNLTGVKASLTTTSSSGVPTIDIHESGVSILSTKLTVDVGETTSVTAAAPAVLSDTVLANDAEITIDIDTAGTGATGLKIYLMGSRA